MSACGGKADALARAHDDAVDRTPAISIGVLRPSAPCGRTLAVLKDPLTFGAHPRAQQQGLRGNLKLRPVFGIPALSHSPICPVSTQPGIKALPSKRGKSHRWILPASR